MEPALKDFSEDQDVLRFTLHGVEVCFANALRRTILSDIPLIVIKTDNFESNQCTIKENSGRLHNEIVKQRLSCIPIHSTILRDSGLPDVLDFVDLEAVANKAKKDSRIDTAGFDRFTVEQQITDACRQLNIKTANRSIYNQSESLLDNLNQRDRDLVANRLDLNQDAETLS